jgi:hypothetical protein
VVSVCVRNAALGGTGTAIIEMMARKAAPRPAPTTASLMRTVGRKKLMPQMSTTTGTRYAPRPKAERRNASIACGTRLGELVSTEIARAMASAHSATP